MTDEDQRWQSWIRQLVAGDEQVVEEFWRHYAPRLEGLAAKHLTARLYRREGPDDVVQSVCRTFLRRAKVGQFKLDDSASLWRLLCAITLTKVREKTRFHRQQKRRFDRERSATPATDETQAPAPQFAARQPTPAEAAEFADQLEQLLAGMDEEERRVVELKLEECTNREMAEKLGCSERTVRRILGRVQSRLSRLLEEA